MTIFDHGANPNEFLDRRFRDRITNIEGVCTGVTYFHNGCLQLCLEWAKDGEPKSTWFDEQRLDAVKAEQPAPQARAGGGHAGTRR